MNTILRFKGTLAMLALLGISLFAAAFVQTAPPDISGEWTGEDWGQVVLKQTRPAEYTGAYSETVGKQPGEIRLKWSRIERRFNGTWREGEDRFGELSVRVVGNEIRGALTTDAKSKINPATPRLADLTWTRVANAAGLAATGPAGPATPPAPVEQRTIDKLVSKFPETLDLSTPEAACAAWQRASARKDARAIVDLSWIPVDVRDIEQWYQEGERHDPGGMTTYLKALADSTIVEVTTYRGDLASVVTFLPFPAGKGAAPYSVRAFGRIGGQWKNMGKDRVPDLAAARADIDRKKEVLWQQFEGLVKNRNSSVDSPDQTLAEQPPVVVETFPISGARNVAPGETEIRVRFSKPMADGSWSWSTAWENSAPEMSGQPHYESDGLTCVAKVKLQPGRTYAFWLNSDKFQNFKDCGGRPAVPYLLIFQTKP